MKNAWILYVLVALTAITAARCIRDLTRWGAWESLGFILVKDIALALLVAYFSALSRTAHKLQDFETRDLAVRSMLSLLAVSAFSDFALTTMH